MGAIVKKTGAGYAANDILDAQIAHQVTSAQPTVTFSKDARGRAQEALSEIAAMANMMEVFCNTLHDKSKALQRQSEETKIQTIQSTDKIKSAFDRLTTVGLDKVIQYADATERLVSALKALETFNDSGKLQALVDTLNRTRHHAQ